MTSVTLDSVRFEKGKLWKARYPSLIDDAQAPHGFQFEPAFHVFTEELEVLFQIAEDQDAVFDATEGAVAWQLLVPPDPEKPAPDVTVGLDGDNPRRCRVQWRRSGAPLAALRIACRHVGDGPEPETDAWALTRVEGGVYLVILDRGAARHNPAPIRNPDGTGRPGVVRVVGVDQNSRPIYDLFRKDFIESLPTELSLEPSFRAHHGERLDFKLLLDLGEAPDMRYKTGEDGQVEMIYAVPGFPPESLLGASAGDDRRLCTIEWHHESCTGGAGTCHQGRTANLFARVENAPALESVDPTVIEPPACDASGVCTKPRDRREEG